METILIPFTFYKIRGMVRPMATVTPIRAEFGLIDLAPESELSQHARRLIEKGAMRRPRKEATQAEVVANFNSCFALIGGVPRLALWADENPSLFFAMYSKLIPNSAKMEVSFVTSDNLKTITTDQLKALVLDQVTVDGQD